MTTEQNSPKTSISFYFFHHSVYLYDFESKFDRVPGMSPTPWYHSYFYKENELFFAKFLAL